MPGTAGGMPNAIKRYPNESYMGEINSPEVIQQTQKNFCQKKKRKETCML